MKQLFYFLTVLLFSSLLMSSCTMNVDDDPIATENEISNSPAVAALGYGQTYSIETVLYNYSTLFGERGYSFNFYDTNQECSSELSAPLSFFISKSGKLTEGRYDGMGPYIRTNEGSVSFNGCEVVITEVTDTKIKGKVKGGDDEQYINGSFTAFICE